MFLNNFAKAHFLALISFEYFNKRKEKQMPQTLVVSNPQP